MAEDKKGFVLYADLLHTVQKLPNDKAGELFKHILLYVNDQDPKTDDLLIDVTFEGIKQQLKRDLEKYYKTCERNKINGAKGGRPKNPTKPKKPTGLNGNPLEPKKPDSDNDTDNDIINRFKNNNHEALFMQLNIDPGLMPKYINEFIAKLTASASDIKNIKEVNQWWFNWLKLQPKKNLTYLTPDERLRKGLNPKRTYVWSTIDGSDYAGLLSDEEKKENGLDISQTVTLKLNTL